MAHVDHAVQMDPLVRQGSLVTEGREEVKVEQVTEDSQEHLDPMVPQDPEVQKVDQVPRVTLAQQVLVATLVDQEVKEILEAAEIRDPEDLLVCICIIK